jgi:hypothetical protein
MRVFALCRVGVRVFALCRVWVGAAPGGVRPRNVAMGLRAD